MINQDVPMFKPEVNEDIDFQIFPPPSTDDRDDFKIKPDKKDLIKKISLKHADITPIHKKMTQMIKTTIDQSAYYLFCLSLPKSFCMIKFTFTLIVFFLRPNAALEKATVHSIQLLQ